MSLSPYPNVMLQIAEKDISLIQKYIKIPSYQDLSFLNNGIYSIQSIHCAFFIDCSLSAKRYHHEMLQHIYRIVSPPVLTSNHIIHAFYIQPTDNKIPIVYRVYQNVQQFIYELQRIKYYDIPSLPSFTELVKVIVNCISEIFYSSPACVHLLIFYEDCISSSDIRTLLTLLEVCGKQGVTFLFTITSYHQSIEYADFFLNGLIQLQSTISITSTDEYGVTTTKTECVNPFIPISFRPPLLTKQDLSLIPIDVLHLYPIDLEETETMEGLIVSIEPKYFLNDQCFEFYSRPLLYRVQPTVLSKNKYPFARGGIRNAYHGINKLTKTKIVLKDFIEPTFASLTKYLHSLELNCAVEELASEFNQINTSFKRIKFIPTYLFVECDQHLIGKPVLSYEELMMVCKKQIYFVEPELNGEFIKFNDNNSWVNSEMYSATAQAFSHWTYFRTAKRLIVVDLQGVINKEKSEYILTDPAVHHESQSKYFFSSTNLGQNGIAHFFESHQCNAVCKQLNIGKYIPGHDKNSDPIYSECVTMFPKVLK
ncbi:elongation factor-2 kinase, putative [Entamoeba histolytica HM-1:IMSS-B]|uniref:Elongation factor-2 kinase, putative n=6 Tax=Entamoeba histolytica TaxID=5759 RepID=C4LWZ0_ENTH1|nr:elongation factor-2 kinase, putative [Entamoeba histolytica HM-1:IMSS]EMD45407.1 elongation factor 2 kinase, putative [Entamoeba histolytica KU27]EMH73078.1 elongation factor-2 kinase, putative [Entamoeba histolytica HM-1:IMSS-B]EMS11597.1 elongation factor-2 kinase [Entamoeba histolytica HM-3:IMSS]ENY64741.1 elongation factor-2 kinase, putative [Entamoeba histolytica HM-1:IMSS-A]GAT93239.1 elongation factor 2 kinase putative [Entamoeba histolytica]|eukprot:XP_652177.1 elongation factor-2 kinase, putative [Entamoeba histolytica HM-1:IMSS]